MNKSIELSQYELAVKMTESNLETGLLIVEGLFNLKYEEGNQLLASDGAREWLHLTRIPK